MKTLNSDTERQVRKQFLIYNILTLTYSVLPLIIVPLAAWYYNNWYLLFAILFVWFGVLTAAIKIIGYIIFIAVLIFWIKNGFSVSTPVTFYYLCYFLGHTTFAIGFNAKIKGRKLLLEEDYHT